MALNKQELMDVTVDLVSAYMQSLNCSTFFIDEESAKQYAAFIETVYKKVEELTVTE